jgi:peptidoglycan-N-acetylglucosamine deacetylase
MAVLRARAVAVAAGVPVVFAVLAALLTVASPGPVASAAEAAAGAAGRAAPAVVASTPTAPWYVTRSLVRSTQPPMAVDFRLGRSEPVAFITIDDGVTKDRRGLRYVESTRLPVTAFLTAWTVKNRATYFERITRWGSIQNHSATHASLARSTTDLDHEICYAQRALTADFGVQPWLLRPPYGAGYDRQVVQVTARRCGIREIVMWDAVVQDGRLVEAGDGLEPGSVILLHFTPDLAKDLKAAVRAVRKAGLRPASLADYLPAAAVAGGEAAGDEQAG